MKTISLLTPTGGRGEAFSLCEEWIKNQSIWKISEHKVEKNNRAYSTSEYQIEWLVVDDYALTRTLFKYGQKEIKAPKYWTREINTQRYNMDALLEKVTGDYIFIIEDDEYYSPDYIEEMIKLLQKNDIVGLSNSKYYHLKVPGYKYMGNFKHASLCHTAITRKALPLLYKAVHSGHYYFDIKLWEYALQEKLNFALLANSNLSIGIKGMPGKAGLGAGHERVGYHADDDYKTLQEWLGMDWVHYKEFLK